VTEAVAAVLFRVFANNMFQMSILVQLHLLS